MNSIRLNRKILIMLFFAIFIFLNGKIIYAATYYMPDNFPNLQAAFTGMSGGDTLIIRDGTYTGSSNVLDNSQPPPNGSAGAYTVIKAENDGRAVFDGEASREMFSLVGSSSSNHRKYVQFEGIVWCNSSGTLVRLVYTDHIEFLRCSVYDAGGSGQGSDGFSVSYSDYVLFEDCWSYGAGRKHFYVAKSAEKIVLRRCVVRHDRHFDYADQEAFMLYDCKEAELQNCISIDGDQGSYYTGGDPAAKSFSVRDTAEGFSLEDTYARGCISVGNNDMMGVTGSNYNPTTFIDFVHWDSKWGNRLRGSGSVFNHCTLGNVTGTGTLSPLAYLEMHDPITDSLLYNAYQGIWNATGNDYNALYNVDNEFIGCSPGTHSSCNANSNAIDPMDGTPGNGIASLKYLCRIEDGSDLDGAASDGGDIGATIIKRIGKSGTLWGEPGYNLLQDGTNDQADENLWPFPNEDIIREHMKAYSYDGGALSGDRGFCADGQTLTKYIWEYLGNPIPAEIYGKGEQLTINTTLLPDCAVNNPYNQSLSANGGVSPYSWSLESGVLPAGLSLSSSGVISGTPSVAGIETFTVKVTDSDTPASADTKQLSIDITVAPQVPPTASAGANPTNGTAPLAVSFTGSGTDSDGIIVSYSWNFGDGGTSTQQNPTHTYSSAGNYTATLTVTDDDGATGENTVQITVNDYTPDVLTSVNFQPAGSPIPEGFDADYGYVWDNDRGYGWDQDVSGKARDKNVNSDQLLDTYIYADNSVRTWECAAPNGQYQVSLAVGEPEYVRGNHKVILEGEQVVYGSTQPNEFITIENHIVNVTDGRLTVQIGGGEPVGGQDPWGLTNLNYIVIKSTTDTTPPADVSAFTASRGDSQVGLSWTNPANPADDDFAGTMIRYRTDGTYPTDHNDGTLVCDRKAVPGSGDSFSHTGLQNGTTYYYSAFTYDEVPNYSQTAHVSATPTAPGPLPDTIDPTVTISQPTSGGTYITDQSTITISGAASDNVGVISVTWTNSRGGSGTASGTTDWTISDIPLYCGDDNVITITAKDAANNAASATLTIDVHPCPVEGFGL